MLLLCVLGCILCVYQVLLQLRAGNKKNKKRPSQENVNKSEERINFSNRGVPLDFILCVIALALDI